MENLKEIIKATLFVAGEGIEIEDFSEKFNVSVSEVKKAVEKLKTESDDSAGIQIIQYKNKIQLASNSKYADYISAVLNPIREKALTKAMLETLSIIAYKQPITRMEIEDIRRVSCDYALNILEEHKMIGVIGRKDAVGKPLLYGTTEDFLKRFGLLNLEQLPKLQELLERIAIIREEERKSDSLYNDFKLQDLSVESAKNKTNDANGFNESCEQEQVDLNALQELQSKLLQSDGEKQAQ